MNSRARTRRRVEEDGVAGSPPWMTTYGDLMTQLLCLFVLLFAFSSINLEKFREVVVSLRGALGVLTGGTSPLDLADLPAPAPPSQLPKSDDGTAGLVRAMGRFRTYLKEKGLSKDVSVTLEERGLVVSFMDKVLFDLGESTLRPEAKRVLRDVSEVIKTLPNDIRIEGHTCDLPIHSARFPSNWELSTARATEVLRYLVETIGLDPSRFSAMGYGQYHPRVPNDSEAHRAQNRRVDIVIVAEKRKWEEPAELNESHPGGGPS
ncbi:MAG TPA: flagellar motor protein MotB [Firmicutes bacterium]|nr:flagellar motor protein MotB [Bacillota bacterium]